MQYILFFEYAPFIQPPGSLCANLKAICLISDLIYHPYFCSDTACRVATKEYFYELLLLCGIWGIIQPMSAWGLRV
jgi:hypothetical protein